MTQLFSTIPETESLKDSRARINNIAETLASNFAGSAFPTANLYVGMSCYRTDLGKLYVLKDLTPTWVMVFDGKTIVDGWGRISDLASTGTDLNTLTTSGWYHQPSTAGATAGLNYPVSMAGMLQVFATGQMVYQFYTQYNTGTPHTYVRTYYSTTWGAWTRLLTTLDEGAGKGLDADTVDGYQTAATATASTIPVRDGAGKLAGDITGNAATATAAPWTGITGKPTTMAGYGITDFNWSGLAGKPTTMAGYGITDFNWSGLADKPTTLSGFGITDGVAQDSTLTGVLKSVSGQPLGIVTGVNATYNYAMVHDSSGLLNFSRYTKAHAWSLTLASIDASGNFIATGNVTAYSDARLKDDLKVIKGALDKVRTLTGYTYTRVDSGERHTGLIAQDVQAVLPEATSTAADGMLSVAYGNMAGLLVEAIKELADRIERLESITK